MKLPIRILFVEDDPEMTAVYLENFTAPEYESSTARDGEQAVQVLRAEKKPIDIVVTDNYMPKMDGIAFLRNIKGEFPKLKLVMVTAYGNWPDYIEAHNLGVCKFIDKPVKMAQLKELIKSLSQDF